MSVILPCETWPKAVESEVELGRGLLEGRPRTLRMALWSPEQPSYAFTEFQIGPFLMPVFLKYPLQQEEGLY